MAASLRIAALLGMLVFGVVIDQGLNGVPKTAAEWAMPSLDGGKQRLADWPGQVLVVHFWATWCPICRSEWPELNAAQQQLRGSGGQIVSVALDDEAETVRQFLSARPAEFPVLLGGGNGWLWIEQLGNRQRALPFTVIFDKGGRAVFSQEGPLSRDELPAIVAPLLR